ncbi:MAG TPA: hypothetical protein DCQ92_12055 [Verrucomicrobia subdivision 3 bacterium]|nr:hypothetical protein [Limisphaerales bacterium]
MNDHDQRRYDRATRVQTFGRDNTADFTAGSKVTTLFTSLDDLIVKADDAKADQSPNRVSKETLLDGMLLDLKNISRTAREIEKTENGFAAPYRIPDNPAESAITTHADSVLGKLEDKPADSAAVKTAKAALRPLRGLRTPRRFCHPLAHRPRRHHRSQAAQSVRSSGRRGQHQTD